MQEAREVTPQHWADFVPAAQQCPGPRGHPAPSSPSPSTRDLQKHSRHKAQGRHLESPICGMVLSVPFGDKVLWKVLPEMSSAGSRRVPAGWDIRVWEGMVYP